MKRPKVADREADRRLRREKTLSRTVEVLIAIALIIVGVRGGMLYDRFPSSMTAAWFELIAVPFGAALVGLALVIWVLADRRAAGCPDGAACLAALSGGGLVAWTALCLTQTPVMRAGLSILALTWLGVAVAVGVGSACRTRRTATGLVITLAGIGTLLAVMGLQEYLAQWRAGDGAWRIFAGFAVPNFLAGLFIMTIPVTAALFLRARERTAVIVSGFALGLQVPALLLTQSRLGVAALAAGMLAFGAAAFVLHRAGRRGTRADGGRARRRVLIMAGIALVVGLLAARPVINRLRASRDQSYSARFRAMTWAGVRDMIAARPLMGVGPGAFDVRYPRYARVGYTQHAHNSYLQAAAETGLPGMALLLGALLAVLVAGVRGLRTLPRADGPEHDGIVLAGLLAGLIGAAAHNVFDSDLYVPAVACVFSALCGLIVAWSRPASAGQRASSRTIPSAAWRVPVGLLGVALLGAGSLVVPARLWVADASAALAAGDVYGALDAYRHAARLDPLEPEHALALAFVLNGLDEKESARRELIRATRLADIGKTWYRLGKHYMAEANPDEAVRALERARRADPMHLRSQLALAQAYALAGRPADAMRIYERMVALHHSPVGQIRAIPEVPDWEYGIAYAAIAETALREWKAEEALANLKEAKAVLGELWRLRNDAMVRIRVTDDVLREVEARYSWVLEQQTSTLRKLGRNEEAEAAAAELRRLQRDKEEAAERAEP